MGCEELCQEAEMTLKVGRTYRGVWAGEIKKLKVTKIAQRKDQKWEVSFRIKEFWYFFLLKTDLATNFVRRVDDAAREIAQKEEIAERISIIKEVKELEVKYK